jgi:hypothetical protein
VTVGHRACVLPRNHIVQRALIGAPPGDKRRALRRNANAAHACGVRVAQLRQCAAHHMNTQSQQLIGVPLDPARLWRHGHQRHLARRHMLCTRIKYNRTHTRCSYTSNPDITKRTKKKPSSLFVRLIVFFNKLCSPPFFFFYNNKHPFFFFFDVTIVPCSSSSPAPPPSISLRTFITMSTTCSNSGVRPSFVLALTSA